MVETILTIVIVGALLIVAPFFTIASLNTLFNLGIPVNLETWASIFWLGLYFASRAK